MIEKLNKLNPDTLLVFDYKYGNKLAICGQEHVVLFFKDLLDHGDDNVKISAYNICMKIFYNCAHGDNIIEALNNLDNKFETDYGNIVVDMQRLTNRMNTTELSNFLFAIEQVIFHGNFSHIDEIINDYIEIKDLEKTYFDDFINFLKDNIRKLNLKIMNNV